MNSDENISQQNNETVNVDANGSQTSSQLQVLGEELDHDPEEALGKDFVEKYNEYHEIEQDKPEPKVDMDATRVSQPSVRKNRGLPKKFAINQKRYQENLEKQRRMKKDGKTKTVKNPPKVTGQTSNLNKPGMRRVIVAGKVKYLPMVTSTDPPQAPESEIVIDGEQNENPIDVDQKIKIPSDQIEGGTTSSHPINAVPEQDDVKNAETTSRQDDLDHSKSAMDSFARRMFLINTKSKDTGKRVPKKYAKEIEKEVKKQTVKNIRNFSDLHRIRAIQDLPSDINIDANRASIMELRRIKMEHRKKELEEKKKQEANKRDSVIQEILNNDKMSKFAKALAIKNLSVTSRHRKKVDRLDKV